MDQGLVTSIPRNHPLGGEQLDGNSSDDKIEGFSVLKCAWWNKLASGLLV